VLAFEQALGVCTSLQNLHALVYVGLAGVMMLIDLALAAFLI
jgi:hypothetical protein